MRTLQTLACYAALAVTAAAQKPAEFEIASVKPSAEQASQTAALGMHISGSQVRISYMSLKDYVAMAYRLPVAQLTAPDWMGQARFDIAAKLPDGSTSDQVPDMLQALLADRFELKAHRSSKDFPVYALVVAKSGLKLTEHVSAADDAPAARPGTVNVAVTGSSNGVSIDLGGGSTFTLANNRLEITRATMAAVATTFTRILDRPVMDATGLSGVYDLTFDLTPEDYNATLIRSAVNAGVVMPPAALRLLDTASSNAFLAPLQKFGLELESRKAPLDIIIVDSSRRTPTDN